MFVVCWPIDPRDGEIVFTTDDRNFYRHNGFINLEYLEWELGFNLGQFIEPDPDDDDLTWFRVDAAREVLMKMFANFDAAFLKLLCYEGQD